MIKDRPGVLLFCEEPGRYAADGKYKLTRGSLRLDYCARNGLEPIKRGPWKSFRLA